MNPWERWVQYGANLLVVGTGLVYAIMRYLMSPVDDWSVVNHPWQPLVQHAHVLTAPLLVFACGLIWHNHVSRNWNHEPRRRVSGQSLALVFVPMIVSGYLIQTTVTEGWRIAWISVHLVASTAWTVVLLSHLALPLWQRIRTAAVWLLTIGRVRDRRDLET